MGKRPRIVLFYILILLLAVTLLSAVFSSRVHTISYGKFKEYLSKGYVKEAEIGVEKIVGKLEIPEREDTPVVSDPPITIAEPEKEESETKERSRSTFFSRTRQIPKGKSVAFTTGRPHGEDGLVSRLEALGVPHKQLPETSVFVVMSIISVVLICILFAMIMFRQSQAGRTALQFGRSRARLYAEKVKTVSFLDVAGCEEAKEELSEVVDYLKSPKKYQTLGGRMPKGVLLVGPPGTGKTLIARAVAGEAKRPFFSLSGSEFVEMFVGVGAARVRDLFQQAKDNAPCIIFIDELDAVGRHRGAGLGGGHDEREQTLNQLLVEMDGFDANTNVIILAATNRPDVLDPALLRPGRFDRQVVIDAPDLKGREAILKVHSKEKPLDENVDLHDIAMATPGFTGADLANMLNEAALLAARHDREAITHSELEEATERVIAGPERRSRRLGDEERRRVAYHEAGHALVAALSKHADPVRKISIIPRGHAALGYTMQFPSDDRYLVTKNALLDRLKSLLAGRAAERLVFDEMSTGAADDLNRASDLARGMVCRYGMSDAIGPVALGREQRQVFLGRDIAQEERNYSEQTAIEIDKEVRRIIDEADETAVEILTKYRKCLENIAESLLEKEILQEEDLDAILETELLSLGVELPHIDRRRKEAEARKAAKAEEAERADEESANGEKSDGRSGALKEGWAPS